MDPLTVARPARWLALITVVVATSGCFSTVSVQGQARARTASGARARVAVDGDAVAGLFGLLGAAGSTAAAGAPAGRPEAAPAGGTEAALAGSTAASGAVHATAAMEASSGRSVETLGLAHGRRNGAASPGAGGEWPGGADAGSAEAAGSAAGGPRRSGGGTALASAAASGGSAHAGTASGGSAKAAGSAAGRGRRGRVGRGHALHDLLGAGITVDGLRVSLGDLRPLALPGASAGPAAEDSARIELPGAVQVSASLDRTALEASGGETRLVVQLRGDPARAPARSRLRVHLVIDRSDSMEGAWAQAMAAARALVTHLGPEDLLQIVAYGSSADEVLALAPVGDGRAARAAIAGLRVGGYTNIGAGLELAYGAVGATTARPGDSVLVVLVSDGVPNVGAFGAEEVGRLAADARRRLGCTTTVVGLGAEFDASVLRAVSREGRGGYHVAATAAELQPALVAEVGSRERLAARDLRVRITLPFGVELGEVADGNAGVEVSGREIELTLPALHAAEERRIVVGLNVPAGRGRAPVASVQVRFRDELSGQVRRGRRDLSVELGGSVETGPAAAALAVLDADLASTLEAAAAAVSRNETSRAADLIDAHCRRAEVTAGVGHLVGERVATLDRIAAALEFYGPGASASDRRLVVRGLGGVAIRLGR